MEDAGLQLKALRAGAGCWLPFAVVRPGTPSSPELEPFAKARKWQWLYLNRDDRVDIIRYREYQAQRDFGNVILDRWRIMKLSVVLIGFAVLTLSRTINAQVIDPDLKIQSIGSFSNMRFTEEHQYGNEAELWRAGDKVFGHFFHSEGLAGDTPVGQLDDVQYDPKNGALSFKAKLTVGLHSCKVHRDIPSHDLFKFEGKLKTDSIEGELVHLEAVDNNQIISQEKVILKRSDRRDSLDNHLETYAEWGKKSQSILAFRGPKW